MKPYLLISLIFLPCMAIGQVRQVTITGTLAKNQRSVSLALQYDWKLLKSKRFSIGTGVRLTSYVGHDQFYITAPAKLTSGSTGPFVIFKENIEANIDTFRVQSPQINSLNILINFQYRVSAKILVGFNIDAIGFSFGGKKNGEYINQPDSPGTASGAKPTTFNILLISDNDRGSLNSELYAVYNLDETWSLKISASFLFTEYTTDTNVQQYPEPNDRFRNKSLMLGFGVGYKF